MEKKKVLFVGSFKTTAKDGGVGGQMFACKTLINSPISDSVEWTLIDTTADSNVTASTFVRVRKALMRLVKFSYYTIFFKYDSVLIFVAHGWSFWEKGLMTVIAKYLSNSKVIIAPRSGFIINDINGRGCLRDFIKFVFKNADVVVCQSVYWKTIFHEVVPMENTCKFRVIENMVDFDKYKNLTINSKGPDEVVIVLFMAWVTREKGVFELLEAAKHLRHKNRRFKIVIAGNGDSFADASAFIINNDLSNHVELKGWVLGEKKISLLGEADIFVLPTYFDGYPNSLLEAMAAGKACIATKVGSIPDMIVDGETGIIIDKEDSIQLSDSLNKLIIDRNLRKRISLESREHVMATNSMQRITKQYQQILSNYS